jgi:flagellar motor switch protein FliM
MTKAMSQKDVDRLVERTHSGEVPVESANAPADQRRIIVYDFKRPDKFSKDQIRTVAMMHETFARLVTTTLSARLRALAHVHVASVDQLTYEEFIRSIPNPTTIAVIVMEGLKGSAVLEIDPSVTFAIIDRSFGGRGVGPTPARDITDIECATMEDIVARTLPNLREAWADVIDLRPRLGQIETNPQFAQVVPPSEMVVLVTLETAIGDVTGMINLCIPYLVIEPLIPKLSAQYFYNMVRRPPQAGRTSTTGLAASAEVYYEGERLSLADLTRLKRGSLVRVPEYAGGTAFLRAGGAPLYQLEAGKGAYTLKARGADIEMPRPAAGTPASAEFAGALQEAMRTFTSGIGASLKTIEDRVAELARKQDEVTDQILFESPDREVPSGERHGPAKPFGSFAISDCEPLASFLAVEHPQTVALVASHLPPGVAACILANLPAEMQPDVVARISSMDRVDLDVVALVDRVLRTKIGHITAEQTRSTGGVATVVEILNVAPRAIEKHVIESLERSDAAMAEEIKQRMFVFEDITLLDRDTVAKVLKEIPEDDLALALKATMEKVRSFVLECVPGADSARLQARLEKTGRVRLSDVDAAQQRIVGVIRRMEEEGKIVVARPDEVVG